MLSSVSLAELPSLDQVREEKARRHLDDFGRLMLQLEAARHHSFVNAKLEAVARGETKRLMLFEPPGHAKSTWTSWLFAAWYLGQHPEHQVMALSHTADFATSWGRKVRNLFSLPEWPFPEARLAKDSQAADEWSTTAGGGYYAAGLGGTITGKRANLIIIDDPVKGREEANSQPIRQKRWDSYIADVRNRRLPGCAIVLIQTRWHEDDLAGRILPEKWDFGSGLIECHGGEPWEVISLPALAEAGDPLGRAPGEALWPGWYGLESLERERGIQGPRNWSSLFQQRPTPEEGDYFKIDWLRWYEDVNEPPKHLRKYGASDYGTTDGANDFTVHGVIGVDPEDNIYILDWWRKQSDAMEWVEVLLDLMVKHAMDPDTKERALMAWAEPRDIIRKSLGSIIKKRMRERKVYCIRRDYSEAGDKATKARAIQARMEAGKVYLPKNAPWKDDLVSELLHFPAGVHDDAVDVLSLFGRMLDRLVPGRVREEPKEINLGRPTLDELLNLQPKQDSEGFERI